MGGCEGVRPPPSEGKHLSLDSYERAQKRPICSPTPPKKRVKVPIQSLRRRGCINVPVDRAYTNGRLNCFSISLFILVFGIKNIAFDFFISYSYVVYQTSICYNTFVIGCFFFHIFDVSSIPHLYMLSLLNFFDE